MRSAAQHLTCDAAEGRRYRQALNDYLVVNVDDGLTCRCPHVEICRADQKPGRKLAEGQLSYVGQYYALEANGRPLRVLIIGMQTGEAGRHVTMAQRAVQVDNAAKGVRGFDTAHMRGTAVALDVVLGGDRSHHVLVDGVLRHVHHCMAMANASLCSSTSVMNTDYATDVDRDRQRRSGEPVGRMYERCRSHLAATVDRLEPTIVIVEGRRGDHSETPTSSLLAVCDEVRFEARNAKGDVARCRRGGHRFAAVMLVHPTARGRHRWVEGSGSHAWPYVEPLLVAARDLALGD